MSVADTLVEYAFASLVYFPQLGWLGLLSNCTESTRPMAIIRVGDDLIDEQTGEYAGPADTTLPDSLETYDDLVAYMHRLSDAEARVQAKRMQLESVIENCRKMVAREEARVDWLKRKYAIDATAIAYSQLPRKKDGSFASKTLTMPWGSIGFREIKPTLMIDNETAALEWCMKNMPSAIKVKESILVTPLKERFLNEDNELKEELPAGIGLVEGRQAATFTTVGSKKED